MSTKLLSYKLVCFCYYNWVSLSLFLTLGSLLPSNLFCASELTQFMGSLAERIQLQCLDNWVFLDTQLSQIVLRVLRRRQAPVIFAKCFPSPTSTPFFSVLLFKSKKVVKLCSASSTLLLVLLHLVKCWTIDDCDQCLEKVLNH